MAKLRQSFEVEKATAANQKASVAALALAREASKLAEQSAAAQRLHALASMSEQGKLIETLRQQCADWAARMATSNFKKQEANIGKAGLFQEANKLVTLALSTPGWSTADKQSLVAMLEEWLPKVVAPWEKDQRKKLKLSALHGQ